VVHQDRPQEVLNERATVIFLKVIEVDPTKSLLEELVGGCKQDGLQARGQEKTRELKLYMQ